MTRITGSHSWYRSVVLIAVTLTGLLAWGVLHVVHDRKERHRHHVERELQIINQLQRQSLLAWREQRLTDAASLSDDTLFGALVSRWLHVDDEDMTRWVRNEVQNALRVLQEHKGYTGAWLIDLDGARLLDASGTASGMLPQPERAALRDALESARAVVIEPRRDPAFGYPFFSMVVPLYDGVTPVAAIWMIMDVRASLYPLLEQWPTGSRTGESAIIMRDGDDVLFLSPLRHLPDTALNFRISLDREDDPAVQTVTGMRGLFYGYDYRTRHVIAVASPLAGTPWFLMSKVDTAEAFSGEWRELVGLVLPLLVGLVCAGAVLIWLQRVAWQRERMLKQALERQVRIDSLTEIANRRALDERLEQEWARSLRQQVPLSLLMIDVDHFKNYNDHYGHVAGDQCLRDVAGIIASVVLRSADLVARYGGEEFVVVLPDTATDEAHQLAARIATAVRARAIEHRGSPVGTLTVSIGVASATAMRDTGGTGSRDGVRDLLQRADAALYHAKITGRDQIVVSDPLVTPD